MSSTRRTAPRREQPCRLVGDQDLSGGRRALGGDRPSDCRTDDDELTIRSTDQEQVDVATADPHRHRQVQSPDRRHSRRVAEGTAHRHCRAAARLGMIVAVEQQQQRVAAELEQLTSLLGGDLQHRSEDAAQRVDQFLGSDPATRGQAFGEGGEPRDVGEAERPVEHSPATLGFARHPLGGDRWHVAAEWLTDRSEVLVGAYMAHSTGVPPLARARTPVISTRLHSTVPRRRDAGLDTPPARLMVVASVPSTSAPISTSSELNQSQSSSTTIEASAPYVLL